MLKILLLALFLAWRFIFLEHTQKNVIIVQMIRLITTDELCIFTAVSVIFR